MFCNQCGGKLTPNAIICPKCGASTSAKKPAATNNVNDKGGCLWMILGYLLGFISLILFFVWRGERPLRAKSMLIGFLVQIILDLVVAIVLIILFVVFRAEITDFFTGLFSSGAMLLF